MYAKPPSHTAASAAPATLASLIQLAEANPSLEIGKRKEIVSAIKTIAKVLKTEAHLVPASQATLSPLLTDALPTAAGISANRWRNAKSLLRRGMAMLDPMVIPARSRAALLPEWAALLTQPAAQPHLRGLARFSKYCSVRGILPAAVTQETYDQFYQDLVEHCILRSPRETQQTTGHAWNKARHSVPNWPGLELTIRNFRRNPSLPLSAFPQSFQQDVDAFLPPPSEPVFDLFDTTKKRRLSTVNGKRLLVRQLATAIVENGRDPASLHSLADLIEIRTAHAALNTLIKRTVADKTSRNQQAAYVLYNIARHWVKADQATIAQLKAFCKTLAPLKKRLTRKNRERLRQFDDPKQLDLLLFLPKTMMAEVCAVAQPTVQEARVAQLAVVIEILLMAPLRIGNISELEIGRTLILNGTKSGYILIDGEEVKNDYDIEFPLPQVTLKMIDVYLKRFHPLLAPAGCMMLFPSQDGGHKRSVVLSHQITLCLRRRCGIVMHAHLFRHLAAKIYLEAFPGAYGIIQILLGHKSIDTTILTYCGTEHTAAYRKFDAFIEDLRGSGRHKTAPARRRVG